MFDARQAKVQNNVSQVLKLQILQVSEAGIQNDLALLETQISAAPGVNLLKGRNTVPLR